LNAESVGRQNMSKNKRGGRDMQKITLECAQDLGIVPFPKLYKRLWKCGFLEKVVNVSEEEYRRQHNEIIDKYCCDKELDLVEVAECVIEEALRR